MIQEQYINIPDLNVLRNKTVLIVGLGALGSAVSHIITPFVRCILLCDHDKVEPKNSNNQFLHPVSHSNLLKPISASKTLNSYYTTPTVPITAKIQEVAKEIVENYRELSIIFDCVDNAETRAFIYSCEYFKDKYIVHTAISHDSYQYAVIKPHDEKTRKVLTEIYRNVKDEPDTRKAPCHILRNVFVSYSCAIKSIIHLCKILKESDEYDSS